VFAPVFQRLCVDDIEIDDDQSSDIEMIHPIIEEKFELNSCDFSDNFRVIKGRIGNTKIRHPDSEYEIELRECTITGDLTIHGGQEGCEYKINKTDIHGDAEICGIFKNRFYITESRFGGILYINKSMFHNGLELSNSEFWNSLLLESSEINGEFSLHPITTDYLVYVSECDIDQVNLSFDSISNNLVRIYYSDIDSGILRQQKQGQTYIDFSYSTLGKIDLVMEDDSMDTLHIYDCEFTEFDFTKLQNQLKESDWHLHDFGLDWEAANSKIQQNLSTSKARVPHRAYVDQFHLRNYVETYIKAKERASRQGDSRSASEFLINEMRAKKKKRAHHLSTSDFGISERVLHNIAQLKNVFLDYSCGFGEKPWKAAGWAAGIPIVTGLILFPLLGGVKDSNTGQQLAFSLNGQLDPLFAVEVLGANLYFSILTFSTIGSSLYTPATTWSHMLMAIQSLLGPFFVALFVFTLGKQVTR
jgi:hypothetical protein